MPAIGMSTSSSLITGSVSVWRSRLRFRFLNRSRLRRRPSPSSYASPAFPRPAAIGSRSRPPRSWPPPSRPPWSRLPWSRLPWSRAALVAPALVAAALVAPALVAAALVAPAVVTAALVASARGLVVPAPVPAPAVTALRVACGGLIPGSLLGVLAGALGRAARLLSRGLLGPACRPAVGGGLVEAELLLPGSFGSVGADPGPLTARAGPNACRGAFSDASLRACVWFHSVLLPQASRVSSRGRDTLV